MTLRAPLGATSGAVRARLAWRRAVRADLAALRDFLAADEARRVGFSARLLHEEGGARVLKLPSPLRGAIWLAELPEGRGIAGALLCHPSRLAFPIFPAPSEAPSPAEKVDRDLALLSAAFGPVSALGLERDVLRYEAALCLSPRAAVRYRLMRRDARSPCEAQPVSPNFCIRRATAADLEGLLPLQEAYEREEVLTPIHVFNPSACRASLARCLERQVVYVAEDRGVIVGKAATNARGFASDQVGGVYTLPARRGRGVARALISAMLADSDRAGRGSSLFVKPDNASARGLYLGLGYEDIDDYRADYFEA